jgi:putative transposase
MVGHPSDYRWSSFAGNVKGKMGSAMSPHAVYMVLGQTPASRAQAYRALFDWHIDIHDLAAIRDATEAGAVLGNARFKRQVEGILRRRVSRESQGGDRKSETFRKRQKESAGWLPSTALASWFRPLIPVKPL